jgi:hypothetical protein
VFQRIQQTHQAQEQSVTMSRNAQHIQQTITTSGVDTNLMRLAIEVQRLELSNGIDLLPPAWLLGQLLDPHPQAQLHKLALSLEAQPCGPADPNATAPVPGADGPVLTPEWTFDIWPDESSQPRERQRLLDELAQATRAWPEWTVRLNPVQEAAIAPIAVEQAGGTAPPSAWRWCLVQRTPAAAPADGGGKS